MEEFERMVEIPRRANGTVVKWAGMREDGVADVMTACWRKKISLP